MLFFKENSNNKNSALVKALISNPNTELKIDASFKNHDTITGLTSFKPRDNKHSTQIEVKYGQSFTKTLGRLEIDIE